MISWDDNTKTYSCSACGAKLKIVQPKPGEAAPAIRVAQFTTEHSKPH